MEKNKQIQRHLKRGSIFLHRTVLFQIKHVWARQLCVLPFPHLHLRALYMTIDLLVDKLLIIFTWSKGWANIQFTFVCQLSASKNKEFGFLKKSISILHFSVAWLNYCGTSAVVTNHSPEQACRAYYLYFVNFFFFFGGGAWNCSSSAANRVSSVFPSCATQKHMLVVIARQQMGISTFSLCTEHIVASTHYPSNIKMKEVVRPSLQNAAQKMSGGM